jgi:hypothetical protein
MFKRFMIGFVFGIGAMYWYIHNSDSVVSDAGGWMEKSASAYRDDRAHELVEQQTGGSKSR